MNEPIPETGRRRRRHVRHLLTAAVASLATASAFAVAAVDAAGTLPTPETTFVAITPCRLVDTRPAPDRVGEVTGPLGPGSATALIVTGSRGDCSIPTSARAVALNATALGATEPTFVAFYPAGGERPLTSNLNPAPGQPPTPNKVDVALGDGGALEVFNAAGTVELVIDVTGYYTTAAIDELRADVDAAATTEDVYTRAEVDALVASAVDAVRSDLEAELATKAAATDVYTKTEVYSTAQIDAFNELLYTKDEVDAAFDRADVIAARATGAGVKQTPGPYTVTRLIEGEYEFVFDVSARHIPGNANTPVISAMARCPASVGYTSGGVVIAPGTGELQSVVVRVLVSDATGPLDCGVDLHLKLGNP